MARKVFKYIIVAVIAINLAIFLWVLLSPAAPRVVMPNPNGYDDFVRAAQIVESNDSRVSQSNQVVYYKTMTREELAALVATNGEALKLVRAGLGRESRVTVDYSTNYPTTLMPELASLKRLALLMVAQGRLAELENRPDDAAEAYLAGVRFAAETCRGGLVISKLVGIACENIALNPLVNVLPEVNPTKCGGIARALEAVDGQEEPLASIWKQENLWDKKAFGVRGQFEALLTYKMRRQSEAAVTAKIQATQLRRRWIMIRYAEAAYALDHDGRTEKSLPELVPKYLKAVPKDPATGKDLSL